MLLMKTAMVVVVSTLLLTGCQTTPSTKTAKSDTAVKELKQNDKVAESKKSEYRCKTETTVGTRFGKKVCRSTAQIENDREKAKESLNQVKNCAYGGSC